MLFQSPGPLIIDFGGVLGLGFSLPLRWYGLLTGLGFLAALSIVQRQLKRQLTPDQEALVFDWALVSFLGGIIGARLWFVVLNGAYFADHPADIPAIWNGGQSIQGGFVGGILSAYLYFRLNQKTLPKMGLYADAVALGLPIAQAIGRWGNFFNNEAFGKPTTLPWKLYIPQEYRTPQFLTESFFHPTFAYESLYLIGVFLVLRYIAAKIEDHSLKLVHGSLLCIYLVLYSAGRFWLEFLRLDSLLIGVFPAAQVICLLTIVVSLIFLWLLRRTDLSLRKD